MTSEQSGPGESRREAQAHARAQSRRRRQRSLLLPVAWAVMAIVAVTAADGDPGPGLDGKAAGVSIALCIYLVGLAVGISDRFLERGFAAQVALTSTVGAAGVALAALQPRGATGLAASAAVWMAIARLPLRTGVTVGAAVTVGLGLANALTGISSAGVLASTLLRVPRDDGVLHEAVT
jgi:hypothetical protein